MGRGVESDEEPGRRLRSREKSQDGEDLQINSSEECLSLASDFLPSPCLSNSKKTSIDIMESRDIKVVADI
jgi:hypothetical protein